MTARDEWVREKRRMNELRMDTFFAPDYDAHWGAIAPAHRRMLEQLLALLPSDGVLLDAACGTGKYWQIITDSGRSVRGIDQSSGMLTNAREKYPEIPTRKLGLQELDDVALYDGVICMDAMENVFPEDWPLVLRNFHRALKPEGYLYLTVEIADPDEIAVAYAAGLRLGYPVVSGEWAHEGGYHYYPALEQVRSWLRETPFDLLAEVEGDEYEHYLCRRAN